MYIQPVRSHNHIKHLPPLPFSHQKQQQHAFKFKQLFCERSLTFQNAIGNNVNPKEVARASLSGRGAPFTTAFRASTTGVTGVIWQHIFLFSSKEKGMVLCVCCKTGFPLKTREWCGICVATQKLSNRKRQDWQGA
jgi:hypothetical protein